MFPVAAMCGHRCGFDMTATTAMLLAVCTGCAFRSGARAARWEKAGTMDIMSTCCGYQGGGPIRLLADCSKSAIYNPIPNSRASSNLGLQYNLIRVSLQFKEQFSLRKPNI